MNTATKSRTVLATFGRYGSTVTVVSVERRGTRETVVYWRENGSQREKLITGKTRREEEATAKAFAEQKHAVLLLRSTGALTTPVKRAPLSIAVLHEKYVLAEGKGWARATARNHAARWQKFADFVGSHTQADRVTLETMDEFAAAMLDYQHVASEVQRMVTTVKSVYRFGLARDLLTTKVTLFVMKALPGQGRRRIDEFEPADVRALLAELKPRGKRIGPTGINRNWRAWAVCWLAAASGKRTRSQMLPLTWDAVAFSRGGAMIAWPAETDKLRKAHQQPMPRRAAAMFRLIRWLARRDGITSDYVFPARLDKEHRRQVEHLSYTGLVAQLHAACDRAGVTHKAGRALHGFRRYAVNTVLASGGSIKDAGLWVNDSDLKVLSDSYIRERSGEQRAIAERMPSPDGKVTKKAVTKTEATHE